MKSEKETLVSKAGRLSLRLNRRNWKRDGATVEVVLRATYGEWTHASFPLTPRAARKLIEELKMYAK